MESIANTKYAVVEFINEKTVATIPSLWLDIKVSNAYWKLQYIVIFPMLDLHSREKYLKINLHNSNFNKIL